MLISLLPDLAERGLAAAPSENPAVGAHFSATGSTRAEPGNGAVGKAGHGCTFLCCRIKQSGALQLCRRKIRLWVLISLLPDQAEWGLAAAPSENPAVGADFSAPGTGRVGPGSRAVGKSGCVC